MFIVGIGATSVSVYVKLRDSTTGFPKTGLVFNSAGALCSYVRPKAAAVPIALASLALPTTAWTSGGFVEVDAANAPGLYRLDPPNGMFAVGADYAIATIGFTGVLAESVEVILDPMPDVVSASVVADAGNTPLAFKTDLPSAVNNFYKDGWWLFRTGAFAGQVKQITAYDGGTKFITVASGFTGVPAALDGAVVVNR